MARRFHTLDVFTTKQFAGNPLAVVHDAEGLDTQAMQAIAREFNLSETVFVLPQTTPGHRADIRIFTPGGELPFAGHPTVGTAVLLASLDGLAPGQSTSFLLGEKAGPVPCRVSRDGAGTFDATFDAPRLSEPAGEPPDDATIAAMLGLDVTDIGSGAHRPSCFAAPVFYAFAPVASVDAVTRVRIDTNRMLEAFGALGTTHPAIYVYAKGGLASDTAFHARMFAPGLGVTEDPATGSAVAAFAGVLMRYAAPGDGATTYKIEQGYAMGRPSEIILTLHVAEGRLTGIEIGGSALIVSEGKLFV